MAQTKKKDTKKIEKKVSELATEMGKTIEELATEIGKISRGMEVLAASRLKRKTIVRLIAVSSSVPMDDVERVLVGMEELEKTFLK